MGSDYASSLEGVSTEYPSAPRLSRAFYSCMVSRCYRLVGIAPGGSKKFLEAYLDRFLVEDMKRILRAKHAGAVVDRGSLIPIPTGYDHADLQAMSAAPTLQDAVKSLEKTSYRRVADFMDLYQKHDIISVLEASLDRAYFDSVVRPSLDGAPSSGVKEMVGMEMDLVSIKAMVDLRARGLASDEVVSVSVTPVGLTVDEVARISDASLESMPKNLSRTPYADLGELLQNAIDPTNEESLDRVMRLEIQRRTRRFMFLYALTLGYVLGYVRDAETEAQNLVSVVTGKELGLSDSKIEVALCV